MLTGYFDKGDDIAGTNTMDLAGTDFLFSFRLSDYGAK